MKKHLYWILIILVLANLSYADDVTTRCDKYWRQNIDEQSRYDISVLIFDRFEQIIGSQSCSWDGSANFLVCQAQVDAAKKYEVEGRHWAKMTVNNDHIWSGGDAAEDVNERDCTRRAPREGERTCYSNTCDSDSNSVDRKSVV